MDKNKDQGFKAQVNQETRYASIKESRVQESRDKRQETRYARFKKSRNQVNQGFGVEGFRKIKSKELKAQVYQGFKN